MFGIIFYSNTHRFSCINCCSDNNIFPDELQQNTLTKDVSEIPVSDGGASAHTPDPGNGSRSSTGPEYSANVGPPSVSDTATPQNPSNAPGIIHCHDIPFYCYAISSP